MSEEEIIALRREKLDRWRSAGVDAYPARVQRSHTIAEALTLLAGASAEDEEAVSGLPPVQVTGRIVASRDMGRASFIDLRDGSGRLQVYLRRNVIGEDAYSRLQDLDLGDFLGAEGRLFHTRTGEPTVEANGYTLLAKALRPLPEKWHGLQDVETRYRQRYLDLLANTEARETFEMRSRITRAIRRYMDSRGFMEVETPVLQGIAGGAAARPFITHHNALDRQFYLRIALELHLKRLIVGGFDRVYEIGRVFRNEGVGAKYNPEFTMLESYAAYADYYQVMDMVEEMIGGVALEISGSYHVPAGDGTLDFSPPWRRLTLREAIRERSGIDFEEHPDVATLGRRVADYGIAIDPAWGRGKLIDELLTAAVEPHLQQPTFLLDYPVELSPLAKRKADNPRLVERFELFIAGREVANAYSELNDPTDQRQRFQEQAALRAGGDEEAESADEDFLVALEHGMPPCGGLGIGIDRLVMALTGNASIREVILFPALRDRDTEQP